HYAGRQYELHHRALVVRSVPDPGRGGGGVVRGRAVAAGAAVPAGADPGAAAALAVVLRRAGCAAARGGVADRLLGRRLLLRAHDPALAADVRRAVADRGGRSVAA